LGRVHSIGPLAQLDLVRDDNGELVDAMISSERYALLNLQVGETLVVKPKRLHVFVDTAQ
ncbi:MAG: TOBE-like domain-containing protein, partial [Undibacterium sp.]|nr:TOBE-like domain-containing protein [Undibacterium sp.]